ncbi:acyl-CoA dehydrogenase [Pseudomonas knackmussii B13]|uniref:Acyl-CoA dehydrogenase n=1 Tax=Pseudomonas knackmussii (strain DSM 6978 / CCUG 54928 / LMG 23759 / B13) TaxID=1301098 RepID=A0A024HLU0_PSEKB|nr:acyl-CoA dehydrogenase family protein [Pseudomonas knackmussii]CDF85574.1 acyl-CoA dehydrogenase [Pseudomonas knackmussii B13]
MEFAFTDEQQMIRDSAESFLADASPSSAVRAAMATGGHDQALWQRICAELGWQALLVPEAHGGLGLGFVELAIVQEQLGRRLSPLPFFASALAVCALRVLGAEGQQARWLPGLAEGSLSATLALSTPFADAVQVQAHAEGQGFVLDGRLRSVIDGHSADLLLIPARMPQGISLFAVPAESAGLQRRVLPTLDQTRTLAEIELNGLYLPADALLGEPGGAWPLLEKVLQLGAVALAAEQVGGAQQALDLTVAYTQERRQFGRPVGGFQALKHRMADMMLQVECARSALYYAACVAQEALDGQGDAALAAELPQAAALAKSQASEAFFHCAAESIQLHGGVGFTWEYDPHLYFKRARAGEGLFGTPAWHRERIAAAILEERP